MKCNKTTHTYDEEVAEEIAHKLRLYADFMKSIIEQISRDVAVK